MSKKPVSKLRLIQAGEDNYAKVAGEYSRSDEIVRDHNLWVTERESDNRIMFYSGSTWVVTSIQYKQEIMEGGTGGFYNTKSIVDVPAYEADWSPKYKIGEVYLSEEGRWVPVETLFGSPSVHIWWSSPKSPEEGISWFYNEITVTETADNTYYMTNGFTGGYMGIQDRSPKWVIFSIWDNPSGSTDDKVEVLAQGEGVTVERFGGEGTGGKSYLAYDWKVGETYQLIVNVKPDTEASDKAIFTGWFRIPELNIWRMLASFRVRPQAVSKKFEGNYSFLEDWIGNGMRRQGLWGTAWFKSDSGSWVQATHGNGTTTNQNANNRAVFMSEDKRRLVMITGGPALNDLSLGPYDVVQSPIPSVLTRNPLPSGDGSPAQV